MRGWGLARESHRGTLPKNIPAELQELRVHNHFLFCFVFYEVIKHCTVSPPDGWPFRLGAAAVTTHPQRCP